MKKYAVGLLLIISACTKDNTNDPINPGQLADIPGDILFISRRTPNSADWSLYIMNMDGTDQRVLSNNFVRCVPPVLSHSGNRVAFTTYENYIYHLYVIGKNGQGLTLLSTGKQYCGSPAWSPDDTKLVFSKNDSPSGGTYDIYSVSSNGGNETKLTTQKDNLSPQWFPDGNKILFVSTDLNSFSGSALYKMNADGSGKQLLTPPGKSFGGAQISPDGTKIAMTGEDDGNAAQVFVMNTSGLGLKKLTSTSSPSVFPGSSPNGNGNPVWSPDGSKIAYVSTVDGGRSDIFVMSSSGVNNKRLTNGPIHDDSPCWTKDGNYIIFSSNRELNMSSEIYIMKANGESQTALTNYIADDIFPVFAPR